MTPGKDTYTSFWIRDFAMSAECGFISGDELRQHLLLTCRAQNGPTERRLAHGLHVPPWAIPDHINYDGQPTFYPGTYSSGEDQGTGTFGRLPPIDDHFDFIHIAHCYWRATHNSQLLLQEVGGVSVFDRLTRAFAAPKTDDSSGLAETTEADRAVGFGFCDAEVHTGKLLFASLLRYRAAGELMELARAAGRTTLVPELRQIQQRIRASLIPTFGDRPAIGGWLRAATGLSRQADTWGTLFALHLNVLSKADAARARQTVAAAVRNGTLTFEGGVRHVPTDLDFSPTTAWERSVVALNTYQNGGYWHTASGWLIEALWLEDQPLARKVFQEMIEHLRSEDFRKGQGRGGPWEVFGPHGRARQNGVYMASVALPYALLKELR